MSKRPNFLVSLKIAELYPHRLICTAVHDEDIDRWSTSLIEVYKDGSMGETIFSFENYIWETPENALKEMDFALKNIMETKKVMSN